MNPTNILILPGWQNSEPAHWQSRWQDLHGYTRVEQHDWTHPLRGDWMMNLEEAVLRSSGPVALVAHSLGCMLVVAWAAHSKNTQRVQAALLVAPPDVEREDMRHLLPSWAPVPRPTLPFACRAYVSSDDPFCAPERGRGFAASWGANTVEMGPCGHLNANSGLGEWPQAHADLLDLIST